VGSIGAGLEEARGFDRRPVPKLERDTPLSFRRMRRWLRSLFRRWRPRRNAILEGFRVGVTDEPNENETLCHFGWLDWREHYGTVRVIGREG
jgi:hypothetical protein